MSIINEIFHLMELIQFSTKVHMLSDAILDNTVALNPASDSSTPSIQFVLQS